MDETEEFIDVEAEEFYGFIRKHLICMLFFLFSYMFSYTIIQYVKMRSDNDELYAGDEDFFVFRVSVWICCCSLSVSIGAVTLLPFSVLGSEVLERYPDNYYLKWLNASLINSLWNYVFMLSNLSLFVLLPFSYFFIEGFSSAAFHLHVVQPFHGSTPASVRRPLLARFYETVVVCSLVIIVLIGIADVFYSHLFLQPSYISLSLLSLSLSLSTPLLYSFASLFGVSLLLLSVPLGFAKMFDVFSEMLITQKTTIGRNTSRYRSSTTLNNGDLPTHLFKATTPERLQALSCLRRDTKFQQFQQQKGYSSRVSAPFLRHRSVAEMSSISSTNGTGGVLPNGSVNYKQCAQKAHQRSKYAKIDFGKCFHARKRLHHLLEPIKILLTLLKYPIIMLILLVLTVLTVSMVLLNTLQLLFGFRALPAYVQYMEQYRHTLGIFGALGEIAIILYIMMSSLVGVYSVPLIRRLQPRRGRTSMTAIIINCVIILVLSSALPVLVRTLGITTFDLLGNYGRIHWISNFSLVWGYNLLFAAASMLCLVNKFTQPVRRELFRRFTTLAGQKHFTYDTLRASSSPLSDIYTDFEDNDSPEND